MLNDGVQTAYKIHKLAFSYLPSLPIKWNTSFTAIQTTKTRLSTHFCWSGLMAVLAIYAFMLAYNPLVFGVITPIKEFDKVNIFLSLMASALVVNVLVGSLDFIIRTQFNLHIINQVLGLERICHKLRHRQIDTCSTVSKPPKLNWNVINVLILPICFVAPLISPLLILLNIDCTYWLAEAYVLSTPMYRNVTEIFLFRIVTFAVFICETLRTAVFGGFLLWLELDAMLDIMYVCELNIRNPTISRRIYIQITLWYQMAEFFNTKYGLYVTKHNFLAWGFCCLGKYQRGRSCWFNTSSGTACYFISAYSLNDDCITKFTMDRNST